MTAKLLIAANELLHFHALSNKGAIRNPKSLKLSTRHLMLIDITKIRRSQFFALWQLPKLRVGTTSLLGLVTYLIVSYPALLGINPMLQLRKGGFGLSVIEDTLPVLASGVIGVNKAESEFGNCQ